MSHWARKRDSEVLKSIEKINKEKSEKKSLPIMRLQRTFNKRAFTELRA